MKKKISLISVLLFSALALALSNCASSDERTPAQFAADYEPPEGSRANPHSYFMDSFNIPKKRKSRPPANTPFFYKHCDDGPGRSPHSATSYDCTSL